MFLNRVPIAHVGLAGLLILCGCGAACDKVEPSEQQSAPPPEQQLAVNSVSPRNGPIGGGGEVAIQGTGFRTGAVVTMDGVAVSAELHGSLVLTATVPPHAAGAVDIVVTNPGGASARLAAAYTYVPLAITAVSPIGSLTGELVAVSGTGFLPGASVTLGGVNARVLNFTSFYLNIEIPPHPPETVDVVVTNPGGERATLQGGFTFEAVLLTAGPSVVTTGDQLTVSWSAPLGRSAQGGGDWLLLVKAGAPSDFHSGDWFDHLGGRSSGTLTLPAPMQPGQYEFCYMVGATAVARSNPVTVTGGG